MIGEAEGSLYDAQYVNYTLAYDCVFPPGGGASEVQLAVKLLQYADTVRDERDYCIYYIANSLDIIPYTLAENAGVNPLEVLTQLSELYTK